MAFDFQFGAAATYATEGARGTLAYPVPLEIDPANWPEGAKAGGADFRVFADAARTVALPYAILSGEWDDATKSARVWVKRDVPDQPSDTLYPAWGNPALEDASDPAAVFTFFDDFTNTVTGVMPAGTDAGFSSAFCPLNRRLYTFGVDTGSGAAWAAILWRDVDTGETGFVGRGLDTPVINAGVLWSTSENKFFLYGGRRVSDFAQQALIQTLDPVGVVFDTLAVALPEAMSDMLAFEYPATGDNYLAGGWTGGSNVRDQFLVHAISAGTVSDTGARLPSARSSMGGAWVESKSLFYGMAGWVGGAGPGANLDDVWTYDPAAPGTDPVVLPITLASPGENPGVADVAGTLVVAGGVNRGAGGGGSNLYLDAIEEIDTADDSIATQAETLDRVDDDLRGHYDATLGKVLIWPVLHSSQATDNEHYEKVVAAEYDPVTHALAAEPALGALPAGWTGTGHASESSVRTPVAIGGSMMALVDDETNKFVAAEHDLGAALSGELMLEARVSINAPGVNYQMRTGDGAFGASEIGILRTSSGTNWNLFTSSDTAIAAIPVAEWQTIGLLVDTAAQECYGLLNRANKTAAKAYRDAGAAMEKIWLNTETAKRMGFAVDWVLVRKSSVAVEPLPSLGAARALTGRVCGSVQVRPAVEGNVQLRPCD